MSKSRIKDFRADILREAHVNEAEVLRVLAARDMIQLADNRLIQASYSYGPLSSLWKPQIYIDSRFCGSVGDFLITRNHEHLLDTINWCRLLWVGDANPRAHFISTTSEQNR